MCTGQQVRAAESRTPRSASATASLEVPAGTAGAARTGDSAMASPAGSVTAGPGPAVVQLRLLTAEEVSPLGDIRCWA
jgi:hypothetical protein